MPSTATAGRTSFLPFCCNQAAAKKAMSAENPLFQAFSPIPVWGSTDSDCIKVGVKIDPTSGSGSLLLTIGHAAAKYMDDPNRIRYYAQELKSNTYNLTRMNLVMRGILPDNIVTRNGDTLEEDWPYFDESDPAGTYDPLYVDAVVSNPPYSQRWDPSGKENDPRYSSYGLAPKSKADYAFLLHDLYHLKPDGIMNIVLPHGVLFRGGEEGEIRKNLIEHNNIDAIIGLPANIFFGTGIPTIIMVLRQKRENTDVLIIDALKGFEKEGKQNKLRACDIRKIADTVKDRKEIDKYSRRISREEIRANDYNLNIPRYVDSSEEAESWDIYATMFGGIPQKELAVLDNYWKVFPSLKSDLFTGDGAYVSLRDKNVKDIIRTNEDVQRFCSDFADAFRGFGEHLDQVLIDNAETLSIVRTEDSITEEIFRRFADIPLADPYEAYEIFQTTYKEISGDLELIQSEGTDAIRQVDPNMVIKKKGGRDSEVQEGWKGHILPFELVQQVLLLDQTKDIENLQNRLQEIPGEQENILEEMNEEDKDALGDALNEAGDAFIFKNIKSVIKTLEADDPQENRNRIAALKNAKKLNDEEKKIKKEIKTEQEDLQMQTKDTIEHLTDDQMRQMLHEKWITPVCEGIQNMSSEILEQFTKQVKAISEKYAETMNDIEQEIAETEKELNSMLAELTGSEADMAGIQELRKLLGGNDNE